MTEEKELTLTQKIANVLNESKATESEGYTGTEWTEALALLSKLDPPVVLRIPWCVWDYELDDFGAHVMESEYDAWGRQKNLKEDRTEDPDWKPKPKRVSRSDVLAILALIPMKREDPELTLEQVDSMLNHETIREVTRMVFKFWGVDLDPIEKRLEELAESEETGEEDEEKEEAETPENFTE